MNIQKEEITCKVCGSDILCAMIDTMYGWLCADCIDEKFKEFENKLKEKETIDYSFIKDFKWIKKILFFDKINFKNGCLEIADFCFSGELIKYRVVMHKYIDNDLECHIGFEENTKILIFAK